MRPSTSLRSTWAILPVLLAALFAAASCSSARGTVDVQFLAFNDFHGRLEPPSGATGRIGDVPAGGIEYFATHLARLKSANPNSMVISAGDNIGATPFLSGLFHDEPTVEALNTLGLEVSAVGNHELDDGWWELLRIQRGGCHPIDGCQGQASFRGARFTYLSANLVLDPQKVDSAHLPASGWSSVNGQPGLLVPASTVKEIAGVRVGFVGVTLRRAASIIRRDRIEGISFTPEVEAVNGAVKQLVDDGVRTIVVLAHEGAEPAGNDINRCDGPAGDVFAILKDLSPDVDLVISGHTHRAYVCMVGDVLLTSAASYGRVITSIDVRIDRRTGDVTSKRARNVIVSRDVEKDPRQTRLLDRYRPLAASHGARPVGQLTASVMQRNNQAGESALGDLVADSALDGAKAATSGDAVVAFVNPGGIRTDLVRRPDGSPITYADAFEVLPFGNMVVVKTLTGDAIVRLLEQQFDNPTPGESRVLQVSDGFSYSYDQSRPAGQRVTRSSIVIGGQRLDPKKSYRVVMSDFLWAGGDKMTVALEGTDPVVIDEDVQLLVNYLEKRSPISPRLPNRIHRE
jgi:5'-nucleotidase